MNEVTETTLNVTRDHIESVVNSADTKSNKIRELYANGLKKNHIAKLLNIKYQHVRNVLLQPLKKQITKTAIDHLVESILNQS